MTGHLCEVCGRQTYPAVEIPPEVQIKRRICRDCWAKENPMSRVEFHTMLYWEKEVLDA